MTENSIDRRIHDLLLDKNQHGLAMMLEEYGRAIERVLETQFTNGTRTPMIRDAIMDSLFQIWRHPEKYDPKKSPIRYYWYLIARCRVLDQLKRKELQFRPLPEDVALVRERTTRRALEVQSTKLKWLIRFIDQFVAELPFVEQQVFRADRVSGGELNVQELANELGKTENAIRLARKRARDKLQRKLAMSEYLGGDYNER